jgi:hypothetical protein
MKPRHPVNPFVIPRCSVHGDQQVGGAAFEQFVRKTLPWRY